MSAPTDTAISTKTAAGIIAKDAQEEDASELRFPPEFEGNNCDALLISEVFLLLDHRRRQSEQKEDIEDISEVFVKTIDYCRRLSKYKTRDTIRSVRSIFSSLSFLHKFEIAQLINLAPENAEEAKALIPSLESKIDDEDLDNKLRDLHNKKTFQ
uniref:RNA polymerase Rpb4/RPC9 core domain-containing protein n=1 Tax=Panagrolaimus sp. JU765 TaxID=591449 RepID=A0AC34QGK0_9BILA